MKQCTRDGIPLKPEYHNLLKEKLFFSMEEFSNSFLERNKSILKEYSEKWVGDPLHQWSRQWEYPFVLERIQEDISKNRSERYKILDAGSGVTFFPYYVQYSQPSADALCCDYDSSLAKVFDRINEQSERPVQFAYTDLRKSPFKSNDFDIIYCVSVLEHTQHYAEIVDEFYRILKPGGRLILTFDLSPDRTMDISPEKAQELLEVLRARFGSHDEFGASLERQLKDKDIFTTEDGLKLSENLLPWKKSKWSWVKSILLGKKIQRWPPLLTFFCASYVKK